MKAKPYTGMRRSYNSRLVLDRPPLMPLAICKGKTGYGEPCRLGARLGSDFCRWHRKQAVRA